MAEFEIRRLRIVLQSFMDLGLGPINKKNSGDETVKDD